MLRITDLDTLTAVEGWVDASQSEILPIDRYPTDEELARQVGFENLDDLAVSKMIMARWLVKQGNSGTALVCFAASAGLPASRLVAFVPIGGNLERGPAMEFPFSDVRPGILSGEVRDLLGEGVECIITHELFREGPATFGVNLVIRRIEHGDFKTLWVAPLESRNLDSYPRDLRILQPLEQNAGAPGTVTRGEVEFQPSGKMLLPVWKATVQFFLVGQEKPVNSVKFTKACPWNGSSFEPVRH